MSPAVEQDEQAVTVVSMRRQSRLVFVLIAVGMLGCGEAAKTPRKAGTRHGDVVVVHATKADSEVLNSAIAIMRKRLGRRAHSLAHEKPEIVRRQAQETPKSGAR